MSSLKNWLGGGHKMTPSPAFGDALSTFHASWELRAA